MQQPSNADTPVSSAVMEALIAWSVKLNSGTASPEDRQAFAQWRAQHASHEAAWQQLQAVEQTLDAIPANARPLITRTITLADKPTSPRPKRKRMIKHVGISAMVLFAFSMVVNHLGPWQQQSHFATMVGERATFTLSDGTALTLNTGSSVDVHYALFNREITLHAGEVHLQTGKDEHALFGRRAFWVRTPHVALEAIGTRFSVYRQTTATRLHVAEGIVAMHSGQHPPVRAYAHESYQLQGRASAPLKLLDTTGEADAWLEGVIVAKQMRLDQLMTELQRYQVLPLRYEGDVGSLKVSGVFQLNRKDPAEHALHTLAQTLPIDIQYQPDHMVIIKK